MIIGWKMRYRKTDRMYGLENAGLEIAGLEM